MIRKVTQRYRDADGSWVIRLVCGHRTFTDSDEHSFKVCARFCPSCPGAEKAMCADARNEIEHRMGKVIEASRPLAEYLERFAKEKDPA